MSFDQYDDPFDRQSAPSVSFKNAPIGTKASGIVTKRAETIQQRDYDDRSKLLFWDDGNPKLVAVLPLRVDGEAKSLWAPIPSGMFAAISAARNELGRAIRPGDEVTVEFVGEKPTDNPRKEPQKLYRVTVRPDVEHPSGTDVFSPAQQPNQWAQQTQAQQPAPQQWAQPQAPQQAPPQQQAPQQQVDPAGFAGVLGGQVDPNQLAAALASLPPEMRAQLTGTN